MFELVDRHVEKENLADFISKKREMFLVQVYSLVVINNMVYVMYIAWLIIYM